VNPKALSDPADVFCYFASIRDNKGFLVSGFDIKINRQRPPEQDLQSSHRLENQPFDGNSPVWCSVPFRDIELEL
jgi:hypothetical protein